MERMMKVQDVLRKIEKWVGFSDSALVADAHTGKAAAAR
jgi:hypothetical protein